MAPGEVPGPDRNGEPWNFCGKCGAHMHWFESGRGFNRTSGERCRVYVWSCPIWSFGDTKHDRASHTITRRLEPE